MFRNVDNSCRKDQHLLDFQLSSAFATKIVEFVRKCFFETLEKRLQSKRTRNNPFLLGLRTDIGFFPPHQRAAVELLRLRELAAGLQHQREVVQGGERVRVLGAEGFFLCLF